MLTEFRSIATGFAAKILLALLVLSFALWGIEDMLRRTNLNQSIATVGGEAITFQQFHREYTQKKEQVQRTLGDRYSPELLKSLDLPNQTLRQMINDQLLKNATSTLGIVPSDDDVASHIRNDPQFADSKGNFDRKILLARITMPEKHYIEQVRQEIASQLLRQAVLTDTPTPPAAALLYRALHEERTVTLYTLTPESSGTIHAPTPDELEAFYNERASLYSAPERRNASYVRFDTGDVLAHVTISPEELKKAYEERIAEFTRPERRTAEQLLYTTQDDATKAVAMLRAGKRFSEVAKSTDAINANALSLGEVEKDRMEETMANAIFSLQPNEISDPVQSAFGWHVFRVTSIIPSTTAPFEKARGTLEKDLRAQAGETEIQNFSNRLEDALAGGGSLGDVAKSMGLTVKALPEIDKNGLTKNGEKAELPALDQFLDTVFATDEKTESPVKMSKGGIYYLVRVDSVIPERTRPLAEIKAQVIADWQREKRSQRLLTLSKTVQEKMADKAQRERAIAEYRLDIATITVKRDAAALSAALLADIFMLKPGDATGVYPNDKGNYVLAVVKEILPVSARDGKAMDTLNAQLKANMQEELYVQYLNALAEDYPVTINQDLLQSVQNDQRQ